MWPVCCRVGRKQGQRKPAHNLCFVYLVKLQLSSAKSRLYQPPTHTPHTHTHTQHTHNTHNNSLGNLLVILSNSYQSSVLASAGERGMRERVRQGHSQLVTTTQCTACTCPSGVNVCLVLTPYTHTRITHNHVARKGHVKLICCVSIFVRSEL